MECPRGTVLTRHPFQNPDNGLPAVPDCLPEAQCCMGISAAGIGGPRRAWRGTALQIASEVLAGGRKAQPGGLSSPDEELLLIPAKSQGSSPLGVRIPFPDYTAMCDQQLPLHLLSSRVRIGHVG